MRKQLSIISAISLAVALTFGVQNIVNAEGNDKNNSQNNAQVNSQERSNDPKYWGTPKQNIQSDADQENYDRTSPAIPGIQVIGVKVFGQHDAQPQNAALTKATFAGSGNLSDHRGSVLPTVNLYPVFWGNFGTSGYQGALTTFLNNIKCSNVTVNTSTTTCAGLTSLAAQYMRGAKVNITVGATYVDTSAAPTSSPTTATIVAEARKVVANATAPNNVLDPAGLYLVFSSNFPSGANYCGYHGAGSATVNGVTKTIAVAYLPNPATYLTGCGANYLSGYKLNVSSAVDSVVNITTHEIYEAMTDSIQSGNAWYDASGYEIGDKCAWSYGVAPIAGFTVQTEFNNYRKTCSATY